MVIFGLLMIGGGIWLFVEGSHSKGAEIWQIIAVFIIVMGIAFMTSPITSNLDNSTKSTNSIYKGDGSLQKTRTEWKKRADEAYEKNNYGFY